MAGLQKQAILEVVDSEKAYVKDLRTIIECFRDPLISMFKDDERVDHLFGNIKEIERANKVTASSCCCGGFVSLHNLGAVSAA